MPKVLMHITIDFEIYNKFKILIPIGKMSCNIQELMNQYIELHKEIEENKNNIMEKK